MRGNNGNRARAVSGTWKCGLLLEAPRRPGTLRLRSVSGDHGAMRNLYSSSHRGASNYFHLALYCNVIRRRYSLGKRP